MKGKIFHPLLFAAYPVLALLAYNIEEISLAAALPSLLVSMIGASLLFVLLQRLFRDWQKAALVSTLLLVLFFSYGHIYIYLEQIRLFGFTLGRHRLLLLLWAVLLNFGVWWSTRSGRNLVTINQALNAVAVAALVFPLAQMSIFGVRTLQSTSGADPTSVFGRLSLPAGRPAPDIYYLILDGYDRDDMLQKFYQLDNTPFLEQLSQMGFYIARCSQSNYAQTQLSLASSLNANYIEALGDDYRSGNTSRAGLPERIKHSAVRAALEDLGYRTIAFETGFDATQMQDANPYLSSTAVRGISDFESLLIRTTAGRVLAEGIAFLNLRPDWEARDYAHRQRVLFVLDELRRVPALPGPKFVFAHIVAPHWPHVFGPNGESVHERPDSVTGYRNQVIFLNKQIVPLLAEIIAGSAVPPIIILQADHGSVIESPPRRMSILNAYHLPGDASERLYESLSPVNSFRVIFDAYFQGSSGLLEDISYYSTYEHPYEFTVVPNKRPGCSSGE